MNAWRDSSVAWISTILLRIPSIVFVDLVSLFGAVRTIVVPHWCPIVRGLKRKFIILIFTVLMLPRLVVVPCFYLIMLFITLGLTITIRVVIWVLLMVASSARWSKC